MNNTTYDTTGVYTHHLATIHGCDSLVILNLTINQPVTNTLTETSCGTYTWNNTNYDTTGVYTQSFAAANGCDSVVTLHLTVNQPTTGDTTAVACGSFTWHGITYTQSATPTYTTTNANGCDSVVTLHLTVNELPTVTITADNLNLAYGESAQLTAHGAQDYVWNTGATTEQITVTPLDTTTYTVTGTDANGCSNEASITIIVVGINDYNTQFNYYPNPSSTEVHIQGRDMQKVFVYNSNGQLLNVLKPESDTFTTISVAQYATGNYFIKVQLRNGNVITKKIVVQHK